MSIESGAAHTSSGEYARTGRLAESQLSLPLELDSGKEAALRAAWRRCGLRLPYHVALRNRPLAICLNCLADAMQKKACIDSYGGERKRGASRRRK